MLLNHTIHNRSTADNVLEEIVCHIGKHRIFRIPRVPLSRAHHLRNPILVGKIEGEEVTDCVHNRPCVQSIDKGVEAFRYILIEETIDGILLLH